MFGDSLFDCELDLDLELEIVVWIASLRPPLVALSDWISAFLLSPR